MRYLDTVLAWTFSILMGVATVYCAPTGEVLRATPGQYDFGIIDEGEPAVAITKIKNIGSVPVEITGVRTN